MHPRAAVVPGDEQSLLFFAIGRTAGVARVLGDLPRTLLLVSLSVLLRAVVFLTPAVVRKFHLASRGGGTQLVRRTHVRLNVVVV